MTSTVQPLADQRLAARHAATENLPPDWRHILHGREIPTEFYSDQPYIVQTDDGAWLCSVTTGPDHEGSAGQHVISLRSTDHGRTWSAPVDVEPTSGPEASYAVMVKVPSGRIYIFYNHNTDNIRKAKAEDPPYPGGYSTRVDSLGYYVFKFSDDHGRSWSRQRYIVNVREFEIDRQNPYGGKLRYFWNVGRPFVHDGAVYVAHHKVRSLGEGFFSSSEGVLLRSDNLLDATDPDRIRWETLPDGDHGLRAPTGGGRIAEEQSFSVLSDGTFYVIYRTIDGHPACAYSRDRGHTWTPPRYETFADGRRIKQPRAATFAWRLSNGRFLLWFHNHGGTTYEDRNPVWLCSGDEVDGPDGRRIAWSPPEIFLYDDDTYHRMSYPDLVEEEGHVYLTETRKDIARVHDVPPDFLSALLEQNSANGPVGDGLLLEWKAGSSDRMPAPPLPEFATRDYDRRGYGQKDLRQGFSVELSFRLETLDPGQVLLETRASDGRGLALVTTARGTMEIILHDGRTENRWDCDPGILEAGRAHHLVAIVDCGPKIITFIVDGRFCDGGTFRQFGWGRFSPQLRHANGSETLRIAPDTPGAVQALRIYGRHLLSCEAIRNFHASGLAITDSTTP